MTAIVIEQGTDGGVRWLVNDAATHTPYDFTGWTVRSQVRRDGPPPFVSVLHEWSTVIGNATVDATGYVALFWTSTETAAWTWTGGLYDIELTSPAGKVSRLDSGRVTVKPEITRDD